MAIKLYVPSDGASINAALEGKVSVGGTIRGIGGKLGAVTSNAFPRIKTSGLMPGLSYKGLGTKTGNNWSFRDSAISSSLSFYDDTLGRLIFHAGNGGAGRAAHPTTATKTEADNFKCRFKFRLTVENSRALMGFFNSADAADKNFLAVFFNSSIISARIDLANGSAAQSANIATVLVDTDYWIEIEHDEAADTLTVRFWTTSPGAIDATWSSPTSSGFVSTAFSDGLFSIDEYGPSSWTSGFRSQTINIEEMFCNVADFNGYSTSVIEQALPTILLDGDLDPSTATAIILKNKSDTPEALTTSLVKIAYSVDGGSFSSFLTFSNFRLEDTISPETSLDFKLEFNNADIVDLIEIFDFSAGDFTGTITSGFGGGGVTTRFSPSQLNAELIQSVIRDLAVERASVSTVSITDGTIGDDTGDIIIDVTSTITVDITVSGANGLDTGVEASSTWYYVYLIFNPTTELLDGLLSISATSPTLPSGYTLKKLVSAVRNDGSSDFINFRQIDNEVLYEFSLSILAGGTATTATAVDMSTFVPDSVSSHAKVYGRAAFTGITTANSSMHVGVTSGVTTSGSDVFFLSFQNDAASKIERTEAVADVVLFDKDPAKVYYILTSATNGCLNSIPLVISPVRLVLSP